MRILSRLAALALLLVPFAFAPRAAAQDAAGGFNLILGIPQGEFGDRLDGALGFGIGGQLLYQIPRSPVLVGAELSYMVYGSERSRECFVTCRVEVNVTTTNNIGMGHFLLRLQPFDGAVQPYLDGLAGVSYLFTESRVEPISGDRPELASSTNFDDLTFSAGVGGGLHVSLGSSTSESGRRTFFLLDAGLRYLWGGEAEYLKRGSITEGPGGRLEFDVERSRTDLLMPRLGVTLRF